MCAAMVIAAQEWPLCKLIVIKLKTIIQTLEKQICIWSIRIANEFFAKARDCVASTDSV